MYTRDPKLYHKGNSNKKKKVKYADHTQVQNATQFKAWENLLGSVSSNLEVDAVSFSKEAKKIREGN